MIELHKDGDRKDDVPDAVKEGNLSGYHLLVFRAFLEFLRAAKEGVK